MYGCACCANVDILGRPDGRRRPYRPTSFLKRVVATMMTWSADESSTWYGVCETRQYAEFVPSLGILRGCPCEFWLPIISIPPGRYNPQFTIHNPPRRQKFCSVLPVNVVQKSFNERCCRTFLRVLINFECRWLLWIMIFRIYSFRSFHRPPEHHIHVHNITAAVVVVAVVIVASLVVLILSVDLRCIMMVMVMRRRIWWWCLCLCLSEELLLPLIILFFLLLSLLSLFVFTVMSCSFVLPCYLDRGLALVLVLVLVPPRPGPKSNVFAFAFAFTLAGELTRSDDVVLLFCCSLLVHERPNRIESNQFRQIGRGQWCRKLH